MGYRADTIALSIAEAIHISPCAIHISERRLQERTGVGNIALTIAEAINISPCAIHTSERRLQERTHVGYGVGNIAFTRAEVITVLVISNWWLLCGSTS